MIRFDNPRQWAPTARAPLPVQPRVQPRVVRLMRESTSCALTLPMPLQSESRPPAQPGPAWRNTRGEIHDTRPDILLDGDVVQGPRPMPIVERCAPSAAPLCKGYCAQGRRQCETPAICSGSDASPAPRVPRARPLTEQEKGEASGNVVGFAIVLGLAAWVLVMVLGHLVARWMQ